VGWSKQKKAVLLDLGEALSLFSPSTNWEQGGPIIEREEISTAKLEETLPDAMAPHPACWSGHIDGAFVRYGPTPLIAAMLCYVASVLGDEVEIPEELK
jgi:hypothetical protein